MKQSLQQSLSELFSRDLDKLQDELNHFKEEANLWVKPEGINNVAGNLFLHICGNLQHFVGSILGNSGYVRQREKEFNEKNVPITEIRLEIEKTKQIVLQVLNELTYDQLAETYPLELWNKSFTTSFFLIHLHSHLNYHLGQINYYRRLI